jgi:hypothetical protein
VGPLRLDDAGDEAVAAWPAVHPDVEASSRVAELLDDVSHRRALSPNWYVTRDPYVASDQLVEVLPRLVAVIRGGREVFAQSALPRRLDDSTAPQ